MTISKQTWDAFVEFNKEVAKHYGPQQDEKKYDPDLGKDESPYLEDIFDELASGFRVNFYNRLVDTEEVAVKMVAKLHIIVTAIHDLRKAPTGDDFYAPKHQIDFAIMDIEKLTEKLVTEFKWATEMAESAERGLPLNKRALKFWKKRRKQYGRSYRDRRV